MIRTGAQYRDSIRGNREIYVDGERVQDVATHPRFKPLVGIRARFYDMQHDRSGQEILTCTENGETSPVALKPPYSQADWWAKRRATDHLMNEIGGMLTRCRTTSWGKAACRWGTRRYRAGFKPA